jgi:hypothetical protein
MTQTYEPRPTQAERDMIVDRLREAVGAGSLTLEEFQERLDAAYRVETLSELLSLLPIQLTRRSLPTRGPRGRSIALAGIAALIAAAIAIPLTIASIGSAPRVPSSGARATAPPTVFRGTPSGGQVAVIDIDVSAHHLTLEISQQDITYPTCSNFRAVSSNGSNIGLAALSPGDFATDSINDVDSCVQTVTLLPAPLTSTCTLAGSPGGEGVTWEGYNQAAHSVLYEPLGFTGLVLADRWCVSISATGANHAPITLSQIPKGAYVALLLSTAYTWVTGVSIAT